MAPIRRYLRITKYSVLECRIYLDNPALATSWLLHPRNPILPKVIDAVRPLVLPKLREEKERERAKKKSAKKRQQIKDVVVEDEFEVSVFLTETTTRHSLLAKHKRFRDKAPAEVTSNASRLIAETNAAPVDVDLQQQLREQPIVLREESDEDEDAVAALAAIPTLNDDVVDVRDESRTRATTKRRRAVSNTGVPDDDEFASTSDEEDENGSDAADEEDGLFVEAHPEEPEAPPPSKRRRKQEPGASFPPGAPETDPVAAAAAADDDKKKMAMDVSFEGFAIYGRVLCLVVKRRDTPARAAGRAAARDSAATSSAAAPGGQAMMENWISSTQMPNPGAEVEGDE
ncbi:hypothetical protein ACHAQA_004707 [Verticillium albo-atrum]